MQQYNPTDIEMLELLTKFARFVSKQFGVQIVFESKTACADDEKVIHLPSIAGMSERDVRFLMYITLHEVGHIRYTRYDAPQGTIKSQTHFMMINAVEDARIENHLMAEYDGAHDMFHELYYDFANDDRYMKRVFGFDVKDCDDWYFLGIYLHNYLVKLTNKQPLSKVFNQKIAKKIAKLVDELKIESYLKKTKLDTWDDAVRIATEVYERFLQHLKDKSEKIDIKKVEKEKEKSLHDLTTVRDNIKMLADEIEKVKSELSEIAEERRKARSEREALLDAADDERKKVLHELRRKNEILRNYRKSNEKVHKALESKTKKQKYEEKKEDLEEALQNLKQQLINETDSKKNQRLQKQASTLEKRIDNQKKHAANHESKYQQKMSEARSWSSLDHQGAEKLRADADRLGAEYGDACDEVAKYKEKTEVEKQYDKHTADLEKIEKQAEQEILKSMKERRDSAQNPNLPGIDGLPNQGNPEWRDSEGEQTGFDDEASDQSGKMVVNGRSVGAGTGCRDMLAMLDEAIQDVQDFNVLEHFADMATDDKLESFNTINNTLVSTDKTRTNYTTLKHVPLTTMYDRSIYKEHYNGVELDKLRMKHSRFIEALKEIFKARLKFNRRDAYKANQEEGKLDTRAIWRIAAKVDRDDTRFFERTVHKFVNKNVASIVLDVSGSMDKVYTDHGKKLRELALFLSEALNAVHIDHEIVGVHAPVCHEMRDQSASSVYNRRTNLLESITYKRFENKRNSGIQNIEIECTDNSDGESLRNVARNLSKHGNKSKMIFYITDGKPYLSDANLDILDSDLIDSIEWIKKQKIKLFAFGFNPEPKKFYNENYCEMKQYADLLNFCKTKL